MSSIEGSKRRFRRKGDCIFFEERKVRSGGAALKQAKGALA
jgi:hypothetical protein